MHINELLSKIFPGKDAAWLSLLEATGILTMGTFLQEGSPATLIETLNTCLQEKWIRPSDKQDWQITDESLSDDQKNIIRQAFKSLNLYDEIAPTQKQYDAALLMGALENLVRSRLTYLITCWNKGVRFNRIYILVGDRALSPDQEPITYTLKATHRNEPDMMMQIVSDAVKEGAFPGAEIIYAHAPKQSNAVRATSMDNIISWEKQRRINDHHILLVTNQPYIAYQSTIASQVLSNNFREKVSCVTGKETHFKVSDKYDVEAVGQSNSIHTLTVGLDCLARIVYASKELLKLKCMPS